MMTEEDHVILEHEVIKKWERSQCGVDWRVNGELAFPAVGRLYRDFE